MNAFFPIVRELLGMFVDDEFLAVAILAVVAVAAVLIFGIGASPFAAGGVLLFGCIAVLLYSVFKASRKKI